MKTSASYSILFGYALLLAGACAIFAVIPVGYALQFAKDYWNWSDDTFLGVLLSVGIALGICLGISAALLTYTRRWFHAACLVIGMCGAALCGWQASFWLDESERLTGKLGPFSGLAESIAGLGYILLAIAFALAMLAGLLGLVGRSLALRRGSAN